MTNSSVAVIDYGMGNIRSVLNALEEVGAGGVLVDNPENLGSFEKAILPGVGAFQEAMENLNESGMTEALNAHVSRGNQLLGVCLGMQLICLDSEENGFHEGLGYLNAHVVSFPQEAGLKVPHMGWNAIEFRQGHAVFSDIETGSDVYFVHSYNVQCADESNVLATSNYGVPFVSIVASGNVLGMQFHPEKSQGVGLQLLRNFISLQ